MAVLQGDPYQSALDNNEDSKKKLLEAVAAAGTQGRKQYQDAQAATAAAQADAIARAQQRSAINGFQTGAIDRTTDRFGQHASAIAGGAAAFQSGLDQTSASGQSYLAKVGATLPLLRSQNDQAISNQEAAIKAAIAEAQAKADAEAAQQRALFDQQWKLAMLRENGDNARAKATDSKAKINAITLNQLVGAANSEPSIMRDNQNILGHATGGEKIKAANLADRARQLGTKAGVDASKLAGLTEPGFLAGLARDLTSPAAPLQVPGALSDANWIKTKLGVSDKRAGEVLKAPELKTADQFMGTLATTRRTNGRIDDASAGEYQGLTAVDAFNRWLDAQPGIRTMKDALRQYYLPWIEQYLK